jgi:hypothetical protein
MQAGKRDEGYGNDYPAQGKRCPIIDDKVRFLPNERKSEETASGVGQNYYRGRKTPGMIIDISERGNNIHYSNFL